MLEGERAGSSGRCKSTRASAGDVPFHATSLGMTTTAWVRGIRDDGRRRETKQAKGRTRGDTNSRLSSVMRMMEMWSAASGRLRRGPSGQRVGVMSWVQVMQRAGRGLDDSGSRSGGGTRRSGGRWCSDSPCNGQAGDFDGDYRYLDLMISLPGRTALG